MRRAGDNIGTSIPTLQKAAGRGCPFAAAFCGLLHGPSDQAASLAVPGSARGQADSARWTPVDRRSKGSGDRIKVIEVVRACFPPEVIANGGHDELCSLHDGASVVRGVDGAGGDYLALLDQTLPEAASAVVVVAVEHVDQCGA